MDEFVEKIKSGAAKVFTEAEKFTNSAVEKTSSVVNQTKLNYAVGVNEKKIKDVFAQIGKAVYDEYKNGGECPEAIADDLKLIDSLYDEIAELKAKIADMKNSVVCSKCGAYNTNESIFCSQCGEKLQ